MLAEIATTEQLNTIWRNAGGEVVEFGQTLDRTALISEANLVTLLRRMLQVHSAPFQTRVQPWMLACFGAEIAADKIERNHRFLEEALELVQACGCSRNEAHQLVDYVYGRDQGEVNQEVGGVMVTLAALCLANGFSMHVAGEIELARIWTKVEQIRAKQAAKPKHSPLPQHEETSAPPAGAVCWVINHRNMGWYRSLGQDGPGWTADIDAALQFSRYKDALGYSFNDTHAGTISPALISDRETVATSSVGAGPGSVASDQHVDANASANLMPPKHMGLPADMSVNDVKALFSLPDDDDSMHAMPAPGLEPARGDLNPTTLLRMLRGFVDHFGLGFPQMQWKRTLLPDGIEMVHHDGDTIFFGDPNHKEPPDQERFDLIVELANSAPALISALEARRTKVPASSPVTRWRHKIARSEYVELARGTLQVATNDPTEGDMLVAYSDMDGAVHFRKVTEFEDGRYVPVDNLAEAPSHEGRQ